MSSSVSGPRGHRNLPGLNYLRRISLSYMNALERQAAEAETLWNALKDGSNVGKALSGAVTGAIESYYDVLVEVGRGPTFTPHPEWVYFTHTKQPEGASLPTLQAEAPVSVAQPVGTNLETTDFVSLSGGSALPGGSGAADSLYDLCELARGNVAVSIRLDVAEINKKPLGQYLSLVTAKHGSGHAPLLIVVLTIKSPHP